MPPVQTGLPTNPVIPETGVKPQWREISARYLLNAALNSQDTKWAQWVRVISAKKLIDSLGRTVYQFQTVTSKPNTPPTRAHFFTIRARDPNYKGPVTKAKAIVVQCDCARFVYYYEYALWYRGAAYLDRCNGEYPVVTNPALRIGCCKHGIKSLVQLTKLGY